MKEHCYWPLVSDFNNVLSHESVSLVFLRNNDLVDMWFEFLSMLQGMNVNVRETGSHVEFEPSSYYAAFSCELEASAYPLWSIISHLKDSTHAHLAKKMLDECKTNLEDWLEAINFYHPKIEKVCIINNYRVLIIIYLNYEYFFRVNDYMHLFIFLCTVIWQLSCHRQ